MKLIFYLSGENLRLSKEEVNSILGLKKTCTNANLLIADVNLNEFQRKHLRLALAKNVFLFLFDVKISELNKKIKDFDWNSIYEKNFCVRIEKYDKLKEYEAYAEKNLGSLIWQKLKNPKVNLENPKTLIHFFFIKNKVICGKLIYSQKEDFIARKSHKRPFGHPSSLHPKMARAIINLTEIKENETLLDPFCGTGGFLIESSLMGIKSIGYDINKIMYNGCKENLQFFKIRNSKVKLNNALKISDKFDHVATDLPYGLNSNVCISNENNDWKANRINKKIQKEGFIKNLEKFYFDFLLQLRKKTKKSCVIVFPNYVNYKKLLKKSKFMVKAEFSNYVHKSLTRKIVKIL